MPIRFSLALVAALAAGCGATPAPGDTQGTPDLAMATFTGALDRSITLPSFDIPPGQGIGGAEIRLDHVVKQVELPLLAEPEAPLQEADGLGDLTPPQAHVPQPFEGAREREREVGRF